MCVSEVESVARRIKRREDKKEKGKICREGREEYQGEGRKIKKRKKRM